MTLKKTIFRIIAATILFSAAACESNDKSNKLLAKVNGEKLYLSDIYFPENLNPEDSIAFLKNMIDSWIIQQLMYSESTSKLTSEQKDDIERKVETARRLLTVAAIEESIISDSSAVAVSEGEINTYYTNNPDEFLLHENIVKVMYLKLRKDQADASQMKTLLQSGKDDDRHQLNEMAKSNALNYYLEDNVWFYFNDILKEIPIQTTNQEDFLKNNKFYELVQDSVVYYVRFNGYLLSESPSPLVLVRDRIISILTAQKKNQLLNDYRNKIYENALKEKKITLYID
ncbi:MAG: hypothetical protein CVU11_01555 [Bacteroidetes bacterium HGW-Bacteroidetes-6]|jgi:hypothetical protein|nr:MAG: hypothetical protein CVU11_01555 [Bacteroidetes bacterium HGW-Bacteroidetes-6]